MSAARAIEKLKADLTAAKADAARLREELIGARERICEIGVGEESDSPAVANRLLGQSEEALGAIDAALAATDSGAWLAKHDRELARRVATRVQQACLGAALTESELVELVEDVLRGAP